MTLMTLGDYEHTIALTRSTLLHVQLPWPLHYLFRFAKLFTHSQNDMLLFSSDLF